MRSARTASGWNATTVTTNPAANDPDDEVPGCLEFNRYLDFTLNDYVFLNVEDHNRQFEVGYAWAYATIQRPDAVPEGATAPPAPPGHGQTEEHERDGERSDDGRSQHELRLAERERPSEQLELALGRADEIARGVAFLVDENAGILAGHGRLLAARKLGLAEVPVIRPSRGTHITISRERLPLVGGAVRLGHRPRAPLRGRLRGAVGHLGAVGVDLGLIVGEPAPPAADALSRLLEYCKHNPVGVRPLFTLLPPDQADRSGARFPTIALFARAHGATLISLTRVQPRVEDGQEVVMQRTVVSDLLAGRRFSLTVYEDHTLGEAATRLMGFGGRMTFRPALDVVASMDRLGLAGSGNPAAMTLPGLPSGIPDGMEGSWGRSFGMLGEDRFDDARLGLQFRFPIGNRAARAGATIARSAERQAEANRKAAAWRKAQAQRKAAEAARKQVVGDGAGDHQQQPE